MQRKEERECTFEDLVKLEEYKCRAKRDLRIAGIFVLVLSVLLPLLPPKYPGKKAMLDIMGYSEAVMWIVIVLAVVFLWSVYFMLYGLHKDLKEKRKISFTTKVLAVNKYNYKLKSYKTFSAVGVPCRLGRINIADDEAGKPKAGDAVIIEYSKYGKKLLGLRSV